MERMTVAVIFGGRSVEHEVSLVSAKEIIENIDPVVVKELLERTTD